MQLEVKYSTEVGQEHKRKATPFNQGTIGGEDSTRAIQYFAQVLYHITFTTRWIGMYAPYITLVRSQPYIFQLGLRQPRGKFSRFAQMALPCASLVPVYSDGTRRCISFGWTACSLVDGMQSLVQHADGRLTIERHQSSYPDLALRRISKCYSVLKPK